MSASALITFLLLALKVLVTTLSALFYIEYKSFSYTSLP